MDMINEVVKRVENIVSEEINIDKTKYSEIVDSGFKGKVCFIDGGVNEIIKAANFSVHLVRVFYCIYSGNQKLKSDKKEFYVLIHSGKSEVFPINYSIESLSLDIENPENTVMKCAELKIAKELIGELSHGDVIVRDGDLEGNEVEEKYLRCLFELGNEKGVKICGLAKTSDLLKEKDSFSAALARNEIYPTWYYFLEEGLSFVKIHPKSRYVFKFSGDVSVLPVLVNNSKDPVFLGYPYGLILADKFARVTNEETEIARIKFLMKFKDKGLLEKYRNSLSAHEVLDNIS